MHQIEKNVRMYIDNFNTRTLGQINSKMEFISELPRSLKTVYVAKNEKRTNDAEIKKYDSLNRGFVCGLTKFWFTIGQQRIIFDIQIGRQGINKGIIQAYESALASIKKESEGINLCWKLLSGFNLKGEEIMYVTDDGQDDGNDKKPTYFHIIHNFSKDSNNDCISGITNVRHKGLYLNRDDAISAADDNTYHVTCIYNFDSVIILTPGKSVVLD